MAIVLAFAGKIGSGKTTITKALADALGCSRTGFGDYVRQVVATRGLPQTRANLQIVGTELLEEDLHGFCRAVLFNCGWSPGETLVIDGLRHAETIDPIRDLVSPVPLRIIFVDVEEKVRLERLIGRADRDDQPAAQMDAHSSEQQVNSNLRERADLIIQGTDPVQDNIRKILDWIGD